MSNGRAAQDRDGKRAGNAGPGVRGQCGRGERDRVQHGHGGVSGNRDRPQLHRPGGGDDLSADRQLRHHRRGLRNQNPHHGRHDRAGIQRHALQLPLYQNAVGNPGGKRHPRHPGRGHPKAHPRHPGRGKPEGADHLRRHAPRGSHGDAEWLSNAHRPGAQGFLQKEVVRPHGQPPVQRGGGGLRHQAEHRAQAERIRLQRDRGALRHPRRNHPVLRPGRAVPVQRPGQPGGRCAGH